ncbi:MAG: hypothetical protein QNJ18_03270 [Xenococcaceae cyanobacterium MO_167.B52]|nr:hypothetical protein [Xenococcaceae cyanobacterium MO_167.B52]
MQKIIKRIPIIGSSAIRIYSLYKKLIPFSSERYWINRYDSGRNSGPGSYNQLAEFKAEIINAFVQDNNISTIIEYGCGDGNQLKLSKYPSYIGFDVSPKALKLCHDIFHNDQTKKFKLMSKYQGETAQLTLSLDVIFHLVEDEIFSSYMARLFNSSEQFVMIYSSNFDEEPKNHEKHRCFTKWLEANKPHWKLIRHIPNRFPYNGNNKQSSLSDFYIYEKS